VLLSAAQMMKDEPAELPGFIADVDSGPVLVVEAGAPRMPRRSRRTDRALFFRSNAGWREIAAVSRGIQQHHAAQSVRHGAGAHQYLRGDFAVRLAMRPIPLRALDEVAGTLWRRGHGGDPGFARRSNGRPIPAHKKIVMAVHADDQGHQPDRVAWLKATSVITSCPVPSAATTRVLVLGDGTGPGLVCPRGSPGCDVPLRRVPRVDFQPTRKRGWWSAASIAHKTRPR